MESIGWLISQSWFGPLLIAIAAVTYIGMGAISDWFSKMFGREDEQSERTAQQQTMTQQGIVIHNYAGAPPPAQSQLGDEVSHRQKRNQLHH